MVRILSDVKRIVIHPSNVTMLTPERFRAVPREDWNIYIEGVKQVQTHGDVLPKSTLFMQDKVECRVSQEDKEVFCGIKPRKMKVLTETSIRTVANPCLFKGRIQP